MIIVGAVAADGAWPLAVCDFSGADFAGGGISSGRGTGVGDGAGAGVVGVCIDGDGLGGDGVGGDGVGSGLTLGSFFFATLAGDVRAAGTATDPD